MADHSRRPVQIAVNGVPLHAGQAKAVETAVAAMEARLSAAVWAGTERPPAKMALLKQIREVQELMQCGGGVDPQ